MAIMEEMEIVCDVAFFLFLETHLTSNSTVAERWRICNHYIVKKGQ